MHQVFMTHGSAVFRGTPKGLKSNYLLSVSTAHGIRTYLTRGCKRMCVCSSMIPGNLRQQTLIVHCVRVATNCDRNSLQQGDHGWPNLNVSLNFCHRAKTF